MQPKPKCWRTSGTGAAEENLKMNKIHILLLQQHSPHYLPITACIPKGETDPLETIGIVCSSHWVRASGRDVWIHRIVQIRRDIRRSSVQPPVRSRVAIKSDQVTQGLSQILGLGILCLSDFFLCSNFLKILPLPETEFMETAWSEAWRNQLVCKVPWKIRSLLWNINPEPQGRVHYSRF